MFYYETCSRAMRLLFLIIFSVHIVKCARILGIFPTAAYSHFVLGETIFKELAARGHQVTVISPFPQKEPLKNYVDVSTTESLKVFENVRQNIMDFVDLPAIRAISNTFDFGVMLSDLTLQNENVQDLLHSNASFDLIILEQFLNEAYFGFMYHFKAPLVLLGTIVPSFWTNTLMGNPTPYAYVPNIFLNFSPKMNFWQRAWNALITTYQSLYFYLKTLPKHDKILHKHFPDSPPIQDLIHNASLMFLNSHPTIGSAVPLQPNMIEIGGFHVQKYTPLSENLKTFLEASSEGVVYFSMGSNLQSNILPKEKLEVILKTFSKLKMKVLWKWEDDDLPGKPANVRIEKWLPQSAVLAHKNVKVFITHGGKLSTTESIYFGKPILGIPMFAEQHSNIQEAVHLGYGLVVPYSTLGEEDLTAALQELIQNPRYAEVAKYRSNALHDLQVSPLDKAIYWIEYVIKYKGAPHLRNAGLNVAWYQYLLLDVIFACLVVIWILKKLICVLISKLCMRPKINKQKEKTS